MTTHIGFLRAVNVGKRRVQMARLVEIVSDLGFGDVWTYVNSGNVVFDADGSRRDLERRIGAALEAEYGFEVTTFVRTADEVRAVLAVDPFVRTDGDTYFVTFLQEPPAADVAADFEARSNEVDTVEVHGAEVHWLMRGSSMDTTLGARDWKGMGRFVTSRNTTMLTKLLAKLDAR